MVKWRRAGLVAVLALIYTIWSIWRSRVVPAHSYALYDIASGYHETLASHALDDNTIVFVPVNTGMLHLAKNLLCSLRQTSFNTSSIVFWALDEGAEKALADEGHATYRDASLFSVSADQNKKGTTSDYRRMMKERPKFFISILSAGYNILMLDADTVFWQSPLTLVPAAEVHVDVVYSTDARKFYQTHHAFQDARRRGTKVPPICNGIFWMRSSSHTISLWSDMLDVFNQPPPLGWIKRLRFQDDQRGMDVLLNDGRAQVVEPFPDGITADMIPERPKLDVPLKVQLLDQTQVVNGILLRNQLSTYAANLVRLRSTGRERIAAHYNWDTREVSKEEGARELGMYFLDENGNCITGR